MNAAPRYAVYWSPEADHPLWRAGCEWFAREPRGELAPGWRQPATQRAARYGWHATLKAPRRLREGVDEQQFVDAVAQIAQQTPRFAMPALRLTIWQDFLALRCDAPLASDAPLRGLADRCVRSLEPHCAPLSAQARSERARGRGLDPRQTAHLRDWGYPYVLDRWEFHLSVSDRLEGVDDAGRLAALSAAQRHFETALREPLRCESVCVFVEPAPDAAFVLAHRLALAR